MDNFKKTIESIFQDKKILCGKKELEIHDILIKSIFANKEIIYVDGPCFCLDKVGNVVDATEEGVEKSIVSTSTRKLNSIEHVGFIKSRYIYIYSISYEKDSIFLRSYSTNLNKKKVTFTISENMYEEFSNLSNKMAINKSKFMENKISEFIEKNK